MQSMQKRGGNTVAYTRKMYRTHGSTKVTKEDIFKEDAYHLKEIPNI